MVDGMVRPTQVQSTMIMERTFWKTAIVRSRRMDTIDIF